MPESTGKHAAVTDRVRLHSSKARLLVVDDEPDTRGLLEYRFRREGFEVQTARNGQEALRIARSFRPALIILDIVLPDLDGFSVCDALRSKPETANTPVVLLSSHSGMSVNAHAVESGIGHCFSKCTDLKLFIRAVRDILAVPRSAVTAGLASTRG